MTMATIKTVRGHTPELGENCFVAENATIVGDVITGVDCSIWFQAVVRGDVNAIRMGDQVNVQDGAVIHCTYQKAATTIGNRVSIGHRAIVHGCTIHDDVLIGMGAIVMDGAVVQSRCLVAAGALVPENAVLETGWIYAGIPAKKLKPLETDLFEGEISRIANNYVMYAGWYTE